LVPKTLLWGVYEGHAYHVETALTGYTATENPLLVKLSAVESILQLHRITGRQETIDDVLFRRLAGDALVFLSRLAERWPDTQALRARILRAGDRLRRCLLGRSVPLSWIHGDFWAGNLLCTRESGAVSGIVDWDRGASAELPLHDVFHLITYARARERGTALGEEIVACLLPNELDYEDRGLIGRAIERLELPRDPAFLHGAALLYWLRFAISNLTRYPKRRTDGAWLRKNVFLVLEEGLP
jgi:hypothetical protein